MLVYQHDQLSAKKTVLTSKTMRPFRITNPLPCEQRNVPDLLNELATAQSDVASHSAAALTQICHAVITGEGPSVAGRVHFSRTLDVGDAILCERILILAGHNGDPVSRVEIDVLFDINAAASERCDERRFDGLLAKATMHHVMSACGCKVPRREIALTPARSMESWTSAVCVSSDLKSWLATRLRELEPSSMAARAIAKAVSGTELPNQGKGVPIVTLFDLAA
jgi:hypothetical protein